MARTTLLKLARLSIRSTRPSCTHLSSLLPRRSLPKLSILNSTSRSTPLILSRPLSSTGIALKGITPESSNPQPKEPESHDVSASSPTQITMEEYHLVSDEYMDRVVQKLEQLQEAREDVDVEFSVSFHPSL